MKKGVVIVLFAIVVVNLVGWIVFLTGNNQQNSQNINSNNSLSNPQNQIQNAPNNSSTNPLLNNPPLPNNQGKIALSGLAGHNKQNDCWISYQGKVYDITSFLPKHPGSAAAISPYCGTSSEFEEAFSDQHGTSQVNKLIREGTYKGELQ